MGWSAGSGLAQKVWDRIEREIQPVKRAALALEILNLFSEEDADDWESCDFVAEYLFFDEDDGEWRVRTPDDPKDDDEEGDGDDD